MKTAASSISFHSDRAMSLLLTAKSGKPSEAISAKSLLVGSSVSHALKGELPVAGIYAQAAYKAGAITPDLMLDKISRLSYLQASKAHKGGEVDREKNCRRLQLDNFPGVAIKLPKDGNIDPSFAVFIVREELQALAGNANDAVVALFKPIGDENTQKLQEKRGKDWKPVEPLKETYLEDKPITGFGCFPRDIY